ncbi:GNAT family N-acetyltransferase [Thalassotalea nanhaiensis]|uniref:GNAT family N-acetyltransferase n=1 Tax=Thalassotalea nanhaiensis TaxID=3065648 RepID=A0ABY9TN42_9GAMM|nr:GNAT family N-acetyltransferase [Colwelliaceae bacterium SQ345]
MKFETLSERHLDLLFQFELDNRGWFESLISSRGDDFYTLPSIQSHIAKCISDAKLNNSWSGVLIDKGKLIARANLKDLCLQSKSCSVGYRVAKTSIGKGYASYCLGELIKKAIDLYSIEFLNAQVLDNNPASKAVLQKFGFKPISHQPNFVELNTVKLGCTTFRYVVA